MRATRTTSPLATMAVAAACLAGALSCGASDGAGDFDGCDLQVTVDSGAATVGSPVRVSVVNVEGSFFTPQWTVRFDSADYPFTLSAGDDTRIDFTPDQPGPYEVIAGGTWAGGACLQGRETINAILPGANSVELRMRLTPPADSGLAAAERVVEIFGGADYALGDLNLDTPVDIAGVISDNGTAVPAYIRVTSTSGVPLADGYSDAGGAYALTVPAGIVDVTVMPADPDIAPLALTAVDPQTIGDINLAGDVTILGTVTGPGGAPMAGARVIVTIDGVPSSIGVTGAGGTYSVAARPGGPASIAVTPPADSGLPIAELDLADAPAGGSVIDVDYASLPITTQSFTITESGGAPAANARVVLSANAIASVAAVTVDGTSQGSATGRVRRFATANGGGSISNLELTDAVYTAVVEPGDGQPGAAAVLTADTSGGAALSLQLSAAPIDWLADLSAGGAAIDGARVRARPLGAASTLPSSSSLALSDAGGAVTLPLIAGASYEIQVDPPDGFGRALVGQVTAPATGTTDAGVVSIAEAIQITGRVRATGGTGAESVHVALFCTDCDTPEIPIAEAVSDRGGRFALELPDPGVGQ